MTENRTEIRIEYLRADDPIGLNEAYAIYHDAILQSEQRTEEEFRSLILRSDYRFLVARVDETILGVSVSWAPEQGDLWLFEYAAVRPEVRGRQIGANLFMASRHVIGNDRTALVEVDADTGTEEQAKRLAFYQRLGLKRLRGLDYLLPLDAFGAPPPMWMLALPPAAVETVPVMQVEDWLRRIYYEVYAKGLDDPRLAAMIDPLPDDVMLDPI